jgi:hypothetical protein
VAPRHPGVDLGHRLQGGCVHFLCVPLLIQTHGASTHGVASGFGERAGQAAARVRNRASAVSVPRIVNSSRLFASLLTLSTCVLRRHRHADERDEYRHADDSSHRMEPTPS